MARDISRGEIWTYAFDASDKRRPVLVLTRQEVISLGPAKMRDVCRALAIASACAD